MNVTDNQLNTLRIVDQLGDATVRRIQDHLETPLYGSSRYTTAQVYGYLRRLEKKKMVRKVKSEGGRHSVRWSITDTGREQL